MALILFTSLNLVDGQKGVSKFDDPLGRYNLTYPSDWKLHYDNDYDIRLLPINSTSKDSYTYFQINATRSDNSSLKDHVFRNINDYIDGYAIGDFILLFSINNLTDNITIDNLPAYKLEYNVIMNDKFQTPVSILEYFLAHDHTLFEIKFSRGGYGIDSLNKNIIDSIIQSIEFE
jgi:hypothetical protein